MPSIPPSLTAAGAAAGADLQSRNVTGDIFRSLVGGMVLRISHLPRVHLCMYNIAYLNLSYHSLGGMNRRRCRVLCGLTIDIEVVLTSAPFDVRAQACKIYM